MFGIEDAGRGFHAKSQRKAQRPCQPVPLRAMMRCMAGLARFPTIEAVVDGHQLMVASGGPERLDALMTLITTATESLRVLFYIFSDDKAGVRVRSALIEAAQRGVKVWILVDGFGTAGQSDAFYQPLSDAGVSFARFLPRWGRSYLLRNHQKIVVADEKRALVGGANVDEAYFDDAAPGGGWHDLFLKIEGPAAPRLARYFDSLRRWMAMERPTLRGLIRILARRSDHTGPLRLLMGGPFRRMSPLTLAIKQDLEHGNCVDLVQAYFAPNWGMMRRLSRVEARHGDVRIITAARSDNNTTIAAARHCYRRLLGGGAAIYEYLPQKLHMKLIIIDDLVYIGSANFDMRSLFINAEIMIRIEDAAFAKQMRQFFAAHLTHCGAVTRESHKQQSSLIARARWLVSYFLVSTLDFTVTRQNLRRL
ncbi:MAG: hypothetical protein RIS52_2202 [Pseudomonadota bacterium]